MPFFIATHLGNVTPEKELMVDVFCPKRMSAFGRSGEKLESPKLGRKADTRSVELNMDAMVTNLTA